MRKLLTAIGSVLVAGLLVVQLIPVERSNPPVKLEIPAPAGVSEMLQGSCYDCHSNRTQWPWYSRLAPASWFVAKHVREGRKNLNLTEWPLLDVEKQLFFLGEMKKQIKAKNMPLTSYLLVHWDARLTDDERSELLAWIDDEILLLSSP